jgi:hypothetical protein
MVGTLGFEVCELCEYWNEVNRTVVLNNNSGLFQLRLWYQPLNTHLVDAMEILKRGAEAFVATDALPLFFSVDNF